MPLATRYVISSQSYDGALGLGPGSESHGGSMYTGLAALALLGTLDRFPRQEAVVAWCAGRQVGGFQGRPNKDEDTCYSFWIGATLAMLGAGALTDGPALGCFASCCQGPRGGISKQAGAHPDVLHSYFAIAGLSLVGYPGLRPLDPRIGITLRARDAARLQPAAGEAAARLAIARVCLEADDDDDDDEAAGGRGRPRPPAALPAAPPSFVASPFCTKAEYEAALAMPPASRDAAFRSEAQKRSAR